MKIEQIVLNAVAENSLNPQSIEAAIWKSVLPLLFKGFGLERAKAAVERIVEVTRLGLARGTLR